MVESGIVVLPRKRKEAERRAEPLSRNPFLRLRVAFAPSSVLSAAPLLPMRQKGPIMAQQQALITITGYVGANPTQFNKDGMPHASSFRMASTRRYFDNRTQQWKDLPTTWITVKAYRNLSENICQSLKKGEPVIVMGALATETWADQNGKPQSRIVLEASAAGHDLNRGVTTLRKFVKPNDQHQPEAKGRNRVWEPIRSSGRAVWRRSKSWFPKMTKPPNSREIPGNSTATYIRRHRCLACLAPIASR